MGDSGAMLSHRLFLAFAVLTLFIVPFPGTWVALFVGGTLHRAVKLTGH